MIFPQHLVLELSLCWIGQIQIKHDSKIDLFYQLNFGMGNKICCEQTRTQSTPLQKSDPDIDKKSIILQHPAKVEEKSPEKPTEVIQIPQPTFKAREVIEQENFFRKELTQMTKPHVKRYGWDVYAGSLDEYGLKPNGFGTMHKPDRSIYLGYFDHGNAHGKGAYIFADGSFYRGDFNHNCAESHSGEFLSQTIHYKGGFKNNKFEGKGIEEGKGYVYEGEFHEGMRTKGTLKWDNGSHIYTGTFNQNNEFHGRGNLKGPQGAYQGDFVNGEKEGQGIYHYSKGSRYEGSYKKGVKEGYGTIFHATGQVAYRGEMKNGLPDGKGVVLDNGKETETVWVQGIDTNLLPN